MVKGQSETLPCLLVMDFPAVSLNVETLIFLYHTATITDFIGYCVACIIIIT